MWESEIKEGKNNLPLISLFNRNKEYSTDIYLHGATITSWKHKGIEKIFVSSIAIFNGIKAIRGGIPVVWPQFGQPDTSMPQHGNLFLFLFSLIFSIINFHNNFNFKINLNLNFIKKDFYVIHLGMFMK